MKTLSMSRRALVAALVSIATLLGVLIAPAEAGAYKTTYNSAHGCSIGLAIGDHPGGDILSYGAWVWSYDYDCKKVKVIYYYRNSPGGSLRSLSSTDTIRSSSGALFARVLIGSTHVPVKGSACGMAHGTSHYHCVTLWF